MSANSPHEETCWFCGLPETSASVNYAMRKSGPGAEAPLVQIEVRRCGSCANAQRKALFAACGVFLFVALAGIALVAFSLISNEIVPPSGLALGRIVGVACAILAAHFGLAAYLLVLRACGTRGYRFGLKHPTILAMREAGYTA